MAHVGHDGSGFALADKVLWRLRKETGTKKVPGLIAVSLLGKQFSVGVSYGSIDVRIGRSGNAGSSASEGVSAAQTISLAARATGMRVSCALSRVDALQWNRIGRLDAFLSVLEILEEPKKFLAHEHVQFCVAVAAAACDASDPVPGLENWSSIVRERLLDGSALQVFLGSLEGHGVHPASIELVREGAASRRPVEVSYTGNPDPGELEGALEALRRLVPKDRVDAVGVEFDPRGATLACKLPGDVEGASDTAEKILRSVKPGISSVGALPLMVKYDGTLVQRDIPRP